MSEVIAALGATIAGGAAIGSLFGGGFGLFRRLDRATILEYAATGALVLGTAAAVVLVLERAVGLR